MSAPITVAVSGWSYPDWRGIVYPRDCRDTLRHVAELVDAIEINVTFYRTPARDMVAGWVERTRDLGTLFSAKLPQRATHDGVVTAADADGFRSALSPLADSGRLLGLLAQFSYRVEADADGFDRLAAIARHYGGIAPLLLEVRHASWRSHEAQARAVELGFRPIHLDYPAMTDGFAGPDDRVTRAVGVECLRLHGRNARAWFDKDAGRDASYDWTYSEAEVDGIARRLTAIAALGAAARVLVAANNHFRGQAVALALELAAWTRGTPVKVPSGLLANHPDLSRIARHAQRGLFDP